MHEGPAVKNLQFFFRTQLTNKRLKENINVVLKSKTVEVGILSADDWLKV